MCNLTKKDCFLIEEYKSAVEATFQMDSLRNKLTSFFISISGISIAGLLLLLKNESSIIENVQDIVSLIFILVAIVGHLFILVLAKIRKVQLEHFGIINNIRKLFYDNDYKYWNASQLSQKTIPKPSLTSGTYFWLLIIQVLNISVLFIGIFLFNDAIDQILSCKSLVTPIIIVCVSFLIQNLVYFHLAKPPTQEVYSDSNPV